MPSIDYARLRGQLRILDLLNRMGWRATEARGEQLRGPCPFCAAGGTSRASLSLASRSLPREFSVHRGRNLYRCFRCGASGNALDLWCAHRRLPLHDAALELLSHLGLATSSDHGPTDQATTHGPLSDQ